MTAIMQQTKKQTSLRKLRRRKATPSPNAGPATSEVLAKPVDDDEAIQVAQRIDTAYMNEGGLRDLIDLLTKNTPGPVIAKKYNVSRQRVNQWKNALGYDEKKFIMRTCIEQILSKSAAS